jgi:hypothetical protein
MVRWTLGVLVLLSVACSKPALTRDGQVVFSGPGGGGAAVLTANGLEIVDPGSVPRPVRRTSAFDNWQAPTGFLLPPDGVLRETSTPVVIQARGVAVVLRASDHLAPAWGGEVLLRVDALVPVQAFPDLAEYARKPALLAVVIDAEGDGALDVFDELAASLGERDRVAVIDSARARTVLSPIAGSHRTLLSGTVERLLEQRGRGHRSLARALREAGRWFAGERGIRKIIVLSDALGPSSDFGGVKRTTRELERSGIEVIAVATTERAAPEILDALGRPSESVLTPPGPVALDDVTIAVYSAPAPAHVLESSGGEVAMTLEEDHIALGALYAGEARTEVLRLAIPEWLSGEPYRLTVEVRYRDHATRRRYSARGRLNLRYSEEIGELARLRHGDVIAYASALAMVRRLERAFLRGDSGQMADLRSLVLLQSRTLSELAERRGDTALARQAEALGTLATALDH